MAEFLKKDMPLHFFFKQTWFITSNLSSASLVHKIAPMINYC